MSVKCKACGFDSADGADWCEMCKEPFHKRVAAKPAPAAAKPAAPELADAQAAAEVAALKKLSPEELLKRLPMELERDRGETVPTVPPWFRTAAYLFALVMGILTLVLIMVTLQRARQAEPAPRIQSRAP